MRITRIITYTLCLIIALSACEKDSGEIFEDSSRNRLNSLFENCQTVLTSAENGWEMQYFINSENRGYNLIASFNDSLEVVVAGKNFYTGNEYLEHKSRYQFVESNGPVLSFNTYNEVLHIFADPDNYDLGGDFEFVILDVGADTVLLKGKKNDVTILLKRIDRDITWENYLANLDSVRNLLFSAGAPELRLTINGAATNYTFRNGTSYVFTVEEAGSDSIYYLPFIINENGLRLAEPEKFTGRSSQNFTLNEDKSALVAVENPEVRLEGPENLAAYFLNTSVNWRFDSLNMSAQVKTLHDQIIESCQNTYNGASDIFVALKGIPENGTYALNLHFVYNRKTVEALLYYDYQAAGLYAVNLAYLESGNSAGNALVNSIAGFGDLARLISDQFDISTDSSISPKNVEFTKTNNSEIQFTVIRK